MSRASSTRRLSRQGRRPHLTVTLADTTLAELDDLPGILLGHGPIPADLARTIARSAASVTALVVDPVSGAPITAGSREYRPRQALRDRATTLADTCRFPSCRQPSWRCDLDHRQPFDHAQPDAGGATDADNLDPTCQRHHLLKHATAWNSRRPPGTVTTIWSSPTGHTYLDPPREAACPAIWGTAATAAVDHGTTSIRAAGSDEDGASAEGRASADREGAADNAVNAVNADDPPF